MPPSIPSVARSEELDALPAVIASELVERLELDLGEPGGHDHAPRRLSAAHCLEPGGFREIEIGVAPTVLRRALRPLRFDLSDDLV